MKIEALTTFLDGKDRFEQGDIRTVDGERGAYFVENGWAKDLSGEVATGETGGNAGLVIESAAHVSGDSNG
ncbi:MAG TPA: hypothetical protein PLU47_00825 [Azonexus sp.]|nr:hypothetical protein [Azonexus sp.]